MHTLDSTEEFEIEGTTELVTTNPRPNPYDYVGAIVVLGLASPILGAFAGWAVLVFRWAAAM